MTQRIILIRHGKTEANEKWLYCGFTDLPLTDGGRLLLSAQKDGLPYPDVSGFDFYTSGLSRTNETLQILFGNVPFTAVPALREMNFGGFEMMDYFALKDTEEYQKWYGSSPDTKTPGGESNLDMQERVLSAFNEILSKGRDALIVLHGGPISAIMTDLFPNEDKTRLDWQPDGGCGFEITVENGRPVSWRPVP